ncbi:MAG: XRE family transcriptional regulator [Pseudomonadota bacterium]
MTRHSSDVDIKRLGSEIREVRKARGMTLKGLSAHLSCSAAYLSRIERGDARVSQKLLGEISTALAVEAEWFFPAQAGDGPLERRHVVRAAHRRALSDMYTRSRDELGFEDQLLSSTLSGQCYLILSRFSPGTGNPPEPMEGYVFDGEQHAIVISGTVELQLGDEQIILQAGDSFSYPSTIAHRFRNHGQEEATMVWAMSPVRITW